MSTLHIEHAITDLETWLGAFRRFEEARRGAGVRAQRVCHPVDDEKYIVVQLDFETTEEAEEFKSFLESRIWSNPDASPALEGSATGASRCEDGEPGLAQPRHCRSGASRMNVATASAAASASAASATSRTSREPTITPSATAPTSAA